MKTFHTTKCSAYLHEKLNNFKGVIRSRELILATEKEIASAMGKQGVTNIRRIQTNTYIPAFNQPHTPKEVKIGYCLERVEQYISALLRWFKCQKPYKEDCRRQQTCVRCREKDPDHLEEDCLKEIKCTNCQQDHLTYARSCGVYKKEEEILEVKHKRNVSFLEARKIVGTCMVGNSYTSVQPIKTINIEPLWRNWSSWKWMIGHSFRSI